MKSTLAIGGAVIAVLAAGAAASQTLSSEEVIRRVRGSSYEIRVGRFEAAPRMLAMAEAAARADPRNAALQSALGRASFNFAAASAQPGADPSGAIKAFTTAGQAYETAVALDPNNAEARAGRGAVRALVGSIQNNPDMIRSGLADLDAAVALAPDEPTPRLQRAFFGVNMPAGLRNNAGIEADLRRLISIGTPRETDVLHLLLGDLYAETGRPALAKTEYEAANHQGSTTATLAAARLADLSAGRFDPAAIEGLRSQLGSNCMICHAG